MWLSANACWLCLVGLYLCSGVDLCEVVRVGTHHCAGCCVLKAAELSRGSSSGPTQTGICTLRCHSGLLQPRCWSRSGTPAGSGGGHVNAETTLGIINKVWKHLSWYLLRLLWLYWSILWHYWQYFGDRVVFAAISLQGTTTTRTIQYNTSCPWLSPISMPQFRSVWPII